MKISQREAHRLRKRVLELESSNQSRIERWATEYPDSTIVHRLNVDNVTKAVVNTARALRHSVVVTMKDDSLIFWGSKL